MLDIAFHVSQEVLELRIAPRSATLSLIVDYFATKSLIWLLGRQPIQIIPSRQSDFQTLSGKLPMSDLVLKPDRPMFSGVANTAAYIQWLHDNLPEGVSLEDFNDLVFLTDQTVFKWGKRRQHEERIATGIGIIARIVAYILHGIILYSMWSSYNRGHLQAAIMLGLGSFLVMVGIALAHEKRKPVAPL